MWTDFDCQNLNADKARVYLERSKSSPINLRLDEEGDLSLYDLFPQIVLHTIGRLKSLIINATPWNLPAITAHLSRHAPLLEHLSIDGNCKSESQRNPVLTTSLFNGDLSPLRELCLHSVRTGLPWGNMVNLTSFELGHTIPDHVSIREFLDFFESAPRLRKIELVFASPTSGAQHGRLVSLARLKWMNIVGEEPPYLLLDHLIIPAGAELTTQGASDDPLIENLLPKSLGNLRNLSGFTKIHLHFDAYNPHMQFSGPNGQVRIYLSHRGDTTCLALESLARFDTSKTEWLRIDHGSSPSNDPPYRALLHMEHLRTLVLSRCTSPDIFIRALDPNNGVSGVVVCPKLEKLVLVFRLNRGTLDIKNVIDMAAARASRGAKLRTVRIVSGQNELDLVDVLELGKHVWRVSRT